MERADVIMCMIDWIYDADLITDSTRLDNLSDCEVLDIVQLMYPGGLDNFLDEHGY
jgi:hypothetical protein